MTRKDELQLDRADAFLSRERVAQRVGVALLTALAIGGALGAFGNGPLSEVVETRGPTELTFERWGRTTAPTGLAVAVRTGAADGARVRIRLDRDFLERVWILEVRPPDAFVGVEERFGVFEVDARAGRADLEIHYKPERFGIYRTMVTPEGSDAASLWQFIYF
jgi:hypothetical protein